MAPRLKQAGRDAKAQHAGEGEEHRQWNGQGDDAGCPQVTQEGEEDHDHQQPALEEVIAHRFDDMIHQCRAVVDGLHLDVRGERRLDVFQIAV